MVSLDSGTRKLTYTEGRLELAMGFGKDGKGVILYDNFNFTLTGLTTRDVNETASRVLREDFRLIKSDYWVTMDSTIHGDVVMFGIANGDLSAAEIEEAIESVAVDSNDVPAIEEGMRAVFPYDVCSANNDNAAGDGATSDVRSGSKTIRWTFKDPAGWNFWFYNMSPGTFGTGGMNLFLKHYGVWVV